MNVSVELIMPFRDTPQYQAGKLAATEDYYEGRNVRFFWLVDGAIDRRNGRETKINFSDPDYLFAEGYIFQYGKMIILDLAPIDWY